MSTLDDLLRLQRERSLGDVHLVHLHLDTFDVAHTDDERAVGANTPDCPVHEWLVECDGPGAEPGIYMAVDDSDPDSMSYHADPYALLPIEAPASPDLGTGDGEGTGRE